jgi:transcriptional regulator of heat shock response
VLKAIVEGYIRSGEPVGSQAIAPGCEVSSATVRNVMSELETQGLLEKAHTSSGRRPTDAGYRYYVDSLLTLKEPSPQHRDRILRSCSESSEFAGCLQGASRSLHDLSRHAVLTLVEPAPDDPAPPEILTSGQSSLLDWPDLDLERIRVLFQALEEKQQLLRILDQAAHAECLQVLIGPEGLLGQVSGVALITFPYGLPGQVLGTVGVIGPTRMDYARVIPLVRYTAQTVSGAMSSLLA